ncbi:Hypp5019 [Branchiostoma lanceolatum]|uniref:Hypp5019 protein n=1 Tax=Branchiostoma lanceolatum TaxID=7740 RepID=A0A8K0ACS7_BRALA|nr:Hypp5019 [Branchiostoma lanceolatum]
MKGKSADRQQLKNIAKSGLGVLLATMVACGDSLTSILMRLTKRGGVKDFHPVLTIGLSVLIAKKGPNAVQVLGMVLCVSGVAMVGVSMSNKSTNSLTALQRVLTLMYPLSACVLFTLCWVMLRWLSNRGVPLVTHMFYYSMSGIILLPLAYIADKPDWSLPLGTWGLLVAQTFAYAMQYLSNAAAIHNETIITVQIVKILVVPATHVLGYLVLGLVPSVLGMSGGTVVTVGATVVGLWACRLNLREKRRAELMESLAFPDKPGEHAEEFGTPLPDMKTD